MATARSLISSEQSANRAERDDWRGHYLGLGCDTLTFEVGGELFDDAEHLAVVEREVRFAKDQQKRLVAIVRPPLDLLWRPAPDVVELAETMAT